MIAEAFETVRYPILPRVEQVMRQDCTDCPVTAAEILHIRHYSLYTPRDFDVSPFFDIIKPGLDPSFDYRHLNWASDDSIEPPSDQRSLPNAQTEVA